LGQGDSVEITHLLLRTQVKAGTSTEAAQETADQLVLALKPRLHLLADWVEVIRRTYLERAMFPGEQGVSIGSDLILWYFDGARGNLLSRGMIMTPPAYIGRKGMTLSEWRHALLLAESLRMPPVEYTYLRDARGSLRAGSTRRAVLDAATAAEISLAKLLDDRITLGGESAREALKAVNRGLMRAVNALRDIYRIALPEDIWEGLADPRNKAIHAGDKPSRDAAKRALDIAAELVELATPYSDVVRLDP
jgi:hypothetical protein